MKPIYHVRGDSCNSLIRQGTQDVLWDSYNGNADPYHTPSPQFTQLLSGEKEERRKRKNKISGKDRPKYSSHTFLLGIMLFCLETWKGLYYLYYGPRPYESSVYFNPHLWAEISQHRQKYVFCNCQERSDSPLGSCKLTIVEFQLSQSKLLIYLLKISFS